MPSLVAHAVRAAAIAALLTACPGPRTASGPTVADGSGVVGSSTTADLEKLVTVDGFTEYRLANGLRVVLFPDPSSAQLTINITYFVGSRHEGYGQTGMAHLLEHMLFKGTPTHDDLWAAFERRGADFNGSTWTDRTNYYETMPATADNLDYFLAAEADRMVNSAISADELATEFTVVRNEFESGENEPSSVLEERMLQSAYLWHNYGKPTIGARSDIERVSADELRAFYELYYQPDNAMLVVAGKFDEAAALAAIAHRFGAIPRPTRVLPATYTVEPAQDGERTVTLRRRGDVHLVGVLYHGVPGAHPDFAALEALADLLTAEPSGRLYRALVEPGLAASIHAETYQWRDPGVISFYAEVRDPARAQEVEDTMIRVIEGVGRDGASDAEVARFRNRASKNYELAMTDSEGLAVGLSEWAALGDWRLMMVHQQRVGALTAADVTRVARERLLTSNRTVGRFVPTDKAERAPVDEAPDAAAIVAGYAGGAAVVAGEAFDATIANLEAHTQRIALAGGLQAAFLSKKTRGAFVALRLTMHVGDLASLRGRTTAGSLLADLVRRGSSKRSYQEVEDELDRLKADLDISASEDAVTVDLVTLRGNLDAAVTLLAEILRTPRLDGKDLEVLRAEELAALEQARQDPDTIGYERLLTSLSPYQPGDPRRALTTDERIAAVKKVKLAELARYHADFWGTEHAEVVVLGDFDFDATRALLEQQLSGWKAKHPYVHMPAVYQRIASTQTVSDTPDKEMAVIVAGALLDAKDDDADYPALLMSGYIMAGAVQSRLWERLREKDGLSYGAWGWTAASAEDRAGMLVVGAIVAPQNTPRALAATQEEIERFAASGVTDDELAVMKTSWLEAWNGNLASDGWVVSRLSENLHLGRTLAHEQALRNQIAALTPAEILAVARKYFVWAELTRSTAGDAAKMK